MIEDTKTDFEFDPDLIYFDHWELGITIQEIEPILKKVGGSVLTSFLNDCSPTIKIMDGYIKVELVLPGEREVAVYCTPFLDTVKLNLQDYSEMVGGDEELKTLKATLQEALKLCEEAGAIAS